MRICQESVQKATVLIIVRQDTSLCEYDEFVEEWKFEQQRERKLFLQVATCRWGEAS